MTLYPKREIRAPSNNDGNPYIDSMKGIEDREYFRQRTEVKELHYQKERNQLKLKLLNIQKEALNQGRKSMAQPKSRPIDLSSEQEKQQRLDKFRDSCLNLKLERLIEEHKKAKKTAYADQQFYVSTKDTFNKNLVESNSLRQHDVNLFQQNLNSRKRSQPLIEDTHMQFNQSGYSSLGDHQVKFDPKQAVNIRDFIS